VLSCKSGPPARPNLVLIIGDDHGYTDFGFMGSRVVQTPHLDRLAAEGTVFRLGYSTASVCRPALQSLLTGLHPYQWSFRLHGLARRGASWAPWEEIRYFGTLPRLLTAGGYAAYQAGKYFEGTFDMGGFTAGMTPPGTERTEKWGFSGSHQHALVRETVAPAYRFIDAHLGVPFFIWFAPLLPHLPHDAPAQFYDLYRDSDLPQETRAYYANISRFDAGVGALVEYLDAKGLRERTLIVYVVDNGWDPHPRTPSLMGGARGKYSLHERGLRTPIIYNWPSVVPAGQVIDALVSTVDLFPTFLDYAGVPPLPDRFGKSLRPLIEGGAPKIHDAIVGTMPVLRADVPGAEESSPSLGPGGSFCRTETWHYISYAGSGEALYNVEVDPEEAHDVAAEHPRVVAQLRAEILAWQRAMRASAPPPPRLDPGSP
jgi:uncharacterized sulfatase